MVVRDIVDALGLQVRTAAQHLTREVTGGCVSDLLSYVMGNAKAGNLWVTIQVHPNIVGVAALLDLAAVIVAGGQEPEEGTLEKAAEQDVMILTAPDMAFSTVGKLYDLGVK